MTGFISNLWCYIVEVQCLIQINFHLGKKKSKWLSAFVLSREEQTLRNSLVNGVTGHSSDIQCTKFSLVLSSLLKWHPDLKYNQRKERKHVHRKRLGSSQTSYFEGYRYLLPSFLEYHRTQGRGLLVRRTKG